MAELLTPLVLLSPLVLLTPLVLTPLVLTPLVLIRVSTRRDNGTPFLRFLLKESTRMGYRAAARYSLHEGAAGNASSLSDYLPLRALRTTRDDPIDLARLA
jgi:hypothetical protein